MRRAKAKIAQEIIQAKTPPEKKQKHLDVKKELKNFNIFSKDSQKLFKKGNNSELWAASGILSNSYDKSIILKHYEEFPDSVLKIRELVEEPFGIVGELGEYLPKYVSNYGLDLFEVQMKLLPKEYGEMYSREGFH